MAGKITNTPSQNEKERYLNLLYQISNPNILTNLNVFKNKHKCKKIAFYGAGALAREFVRFYDLTGLDVVGFYDLDPNKNGLKIGTYNIKYAKNATNETADIVVILMAKPEVAVDFIAENFGTSTKIFNLHFEELKVKKDIDIVKVLKSTVNHINLCINKEKKIKDLVKTIALYLPQYHEIPENNEWWGDGFTEWTNVKKAKPLFNGHNQPKIPHKDIGYYDLSDKDVMKKQISMAKKYGIHGFCFYHYWFNGKRLLEKPVNQFLEDKSLDIPFCLCWANENWTRRWDGLDQEILMKQTYDAVAMDKFIHELIPALQDERYIKINNKPVFFIYRAEFIPNITELSKTWRKIAKQNNIKDLYLVNVQGFPSGRFNPSKIGFDAAMEFAPDWMNLVPTEEDIKVLNDKTKGLKVYDYQSCANAIVKKRVPDYTFFRSVFTSWDNTPRKMHKNSSAFINSSPKLFKQFFKKTIENTIKYLNKDERIVFINAWNEWGEGAHLEPDEKDGYANLEACKEVLETKVGKFL